jgi:hypothetical protein
MNIFVKKSNTVAIPVFCWTDKDQNVEASHVKSDVPEGSESTTLTFTFRRPCYQDSTGILRQALSAGERGGVDVAVFQDLVLRNQLAGWDIKDEEDKEVAVNPMTVNELSPAVARAAVAGYLEKVKI